MPERLRVVFVDDEAAVLSPMALLLQAWGFDAVPFSDFEHARAYLIDQHRSRWSSTSGSAIQRPAADSL
jgi:FixJ family two-component response regulator